MIIQEVIDKHSKAHLSLQASIGKNRRLIVPLFSGNVLRSLKCIEGFDEFNL
ncbi:MAG: hypothetical protein MI922_05280 [Bacteroidales bacterium]|nr:hypothetical protein [Bacteroidales bacterium]